MTEPTPINAVNFRRSVRRLAPYRPFSSGDHRVESARRQFVLAAAHENGGRLSSCTECQTICQTRWGLELERDEISTAIRQLVEDEKLLEESGYFRLTDSSSRELAERVRTSNEVEATAFREWEQTVRRIAPSLGTEHLAQLHEDLTAWIHQIIVEHGIEAGLLLYPEQELFKRRLKEIKALGFGFLPQRESSVMMVRPAALEAFLEYMTPMQRRYFDNLMSTAYLMSVFTLDPAALDMVRKLTNGQRLYLDTNIVYSLLKLNGPKPYLTACRTLALSRQLGYQTCVTPWTVTEMKKSVRTAREKLARTRLSPQALAGLTPSVADNDADEVFSKAFRRMQRAIGISFGDFFALHEQIETLLISEGVEVVDIGCQAIDADGSSLDEQIAVLESVRQGPEKPRPLQEHDVKHRLLVESLRGDEERRFSTAGYLVLTNDHALIRYAHVNRKRPNEMPFAVSLTQWASIVRSLNPRTGDYDKTMADILDTPSVRSPGLVSQTEIIEAIARIDAHEEYSDAIGTRVLLDTALGGDGDEVGPEYYERSETATDTETELKEQIRELRDRLAEAREVHAAREVAVYAELAAERRARIEAQQRIKRRSEREADGDRVETDGGHAAGAGVASSGDEQLSPQTILLSQRLARFERIVYWLVALLIALVGVAVLAIPLGTGWIVEGRPLVGDICAGGAILIGAFAWTFGWRRASALVTGLGVVLGIVAAVQTFVT